MPYFVFLVLFDSVEMILVCQCEHNKNSSSPEPFSSCQSGKGACAATNKEDSCFVSRTGKGCISWHKCLFYDDMGYAVNKTLIQCCKSNFCNSFINQNSLDYFSRGDFLSKLN